MTVTVEIKTPTSGPIRVPFDDNAKLADINKYIRTKLGNMVVGCDITLVSNDDPNVIPLGEYNRRMEQKKKENANKKKNRKKPIPRDGPANIKLRR